MLRQIGLLIVFLGFGINTQAQNYGFLATGLPNPQQNQINIIASNLEEGLGRALTGVELNELKEAISTADLESSNLVRVSKRDRTSHNVLFCLWGAISPIVGSAAAGTCVDIFGNSYGILLSAVGPAIGIVGRVSVFIYDGAGNLPVEGTYKTAVLTEASIVHGGHFGSFENGVGSKRIAFVGWTGSLVAALGISGSIETDAPLGLLIEKLNK